MKNLKGIFSALLVSFNEDGSINEKGLREIVRYNIDKMKIDGLYVGGSTGENFMLSTAEKRNFPYCQRGSKRSSCINRSSR